MDQEQDLARFLALSATLTGFDPIDLEGTGMAPVYLALAAEQAGKGNMAALLDRFAEHVADRPEEEQIAAIRGHVMSEPMCGPLARNLIKLWYFGTWYRLPSAWLLAFNEGADDRTFVVSDAAYRSALVWLPMLAHAKGARQPGFGSWQFPPGRP